MRLCTQCKEHFPDNTDTCDRDGVALSAPDALLGRLVEGRYRVEERLGMGGQGAVYRATHVHLQRPVALKVVRGEHLTDGGAIERFRREALALALMKHENVVAVHDFGVEEGTGAYLVMELLEGRSLYEIIRSERRLPVATAVEVLRQACAAIQAAHEQGVVHRDVKPGNIYLEDVDGGRPTVKVLDFGLAKLAVADAAGEPLTLAGMVIGTPIYMSPEHCRGEELDERADVYSLGCVLYEALTGRPPFTATGLVTLMNMHLWTAPTPPSHYVPEIGPALDDVVLRALAKDVDRRIRSAGELGAELAALGERRPSTGSLRMALDLPTSFVREEDEEPPTFAAGRSSALSSLFADGSDDDDEAPTFAGLSQPAPLPSVVTPSLTADNLPAEGTSFVGRREETEELTRLLPSARLVTLTGPGGCGKTRLSLHVASRLGRAYPDGVWFVELSQLADPTLVPQTVAAALRVREESGRPLSEAIAEYLARRRTLLLLDNCEHVVEACADLVASLLRACPSVTVMATSQEALGIAGEVVRAVQPLSLPDAETTADELAESEAARLFVERARMSSAKFELTDRNAPAVARICRLLDGIPLAIELAAARVKMLSAEQIADRLDDRFRLLTNGDRTSEPRQRTLRGAMEWSYELLSETERTLFERLSVFAGGFRIEAAETVCEGGAIDAYDVLDLLARLVDRSLVVFDEQADAPRYRMLNTIRQYGLERLEASGDARAVRDRHRDLFLALAEEAEGELSGPDQAAWLARLDLEHDNLRAALEHGRSDAAESDAFLRLAAALPKFWYVRNYEREGFRWLEDALATDRCGSSALRAKALSDAGSLARVLRDYDRSIALGVEALALSRQVGDPARVAASLNQLGILAQWRGELDRAEALLSEARDLSREARDDREFATALNNLGVVARMRNDFDSAVRLFEESLALYRAAGDRRYVASTLNNLGVIAGIRGDFARAARLHEEQLENCRAVGERRMTAAALNNLGETTLRMGDTARAKALFRESLALYKATGDMRGIAYLVEGFMSVAAAEGRTLRTLRLAGATAALRESIGAPLTAAELGEIEECTREARLAVGDSEAEAELDAGRAMTFDDLVTFALRETPRVA